MEEEEFDGLTINDSKYNIGLLGAPKNKDPSLIYGKYAVKEAQSESFEKNGKDWVKNANRNGQNLRQMFVLDVLVSDKLQDSGLFKADKVFKNATKISGANKYGPKTDFGVDNSRFIHFYKVAVDNLIKNETKLEILVHSDLDENNSWVKVFSKTGV